MARKQEKEKKAPTFKPAHAEDAGMIPEGSPVGGPSVRFDPKKRQNYHLDPQGQREYHEVPEGFELDDQGVPQPVAAAEPEESTDA